MRKIYSAITTIILTAIVAPACGGDIKIDDFYTKKDTWHDTLYVSISKLNALQANKAGGDKAADFKKVQEQKGIAIGRWKTLPPFKSEGLKHNYGPERSIATQKWIEKPKWRAGYVINMSMPGNSVQFSYCKLYAPSSRTVKAYFGSDDGIAVFLNGARILLSDASRGVKPNQETVKLKLKKGVNHLLIKIRNGSGGSGMYFSLDKRPSGSLNSSTKGRSRSDPLREKLWDRLKKDFGKDPKVLWRMSAERSDGIWSGKLEGDKYEMLATRYAGKTRSYKDLDKKAKDLAPRVKNESSLQDLRTVYYKSVKLAQKFKPKDPSAPNNGLPKTPAPDQNDGVLNGPLTRGGLKIKSHGDKESLRLAIRDLMDTFGNKYPKGQNFLNRLETIKSEKSKEFEQLKKEALLANPLLDFDKLLMVRHRKGGRFARNWQTRTDCGGSFDNELVVMSGLCEGEVETVYKPGKGKFIGDIDLHWDANRLLFTSQVDKGDLKDSGMRATRHYRIFEMKIDPKTGMKTGKVRRISPDMANDIDNYYPCYLPDGRIIFASTAPYEGVPCVGGGSYVANLYRMNPDGTDVRRLTFDQDASWHPSVQTDGRVMYTRWEYTDSAHYYARVLMTMNPDGTDQKAYYGSNSYWPNSIFFARQIPGAENTTKFVATITGHHSHSKGGAACIFDVSKGRQESDGAVQLLGGHGKEVEPLVIDNLARAYSPMFFHPWPLNEKYFLVVTGGSVYLMDVFDNMVCLKSRDDNGQYYEPIPLKKRKTPPVVPDRINLDSDTAQVLINDVYKGPGLKGVPRGTVKKLRIYRYEYGPRHRGGHYAMGMEAGWDAKQVLGTVPVEEDGSANFKIPADTPFALQPLDKEGKALQLMRSWTVAMPGELLSCVGCHESQNMPPSRERAEAMFRKPDEIEPFYGPLRGFSFKREIQPVLDKYCVGCHDGTFDIDEYGRDKQGRYKVADRIIGTGKNTGKKFAQCGIPDLSNPRSAHRMLHPYVRRNGPEGDYHLLTPLEFHANTSELVQMLEKGHHNVKLDDEAWDRIITWIDINAPYHGTWTEAGANKKILKRRIELRKQYSKDDFNPEKIVNPYEPSDEHIMPEKCDPKIVARKPAGVRKYKSETMKLDLGEDITMELTRIPAGTFSMGSNKETPAERPVSRVEIGKPFYMGTKEVTLGQFRQFDPDYLNGVYDMHYKDQVHRGYYMNDMRLPVIRVSWNKAMEFCKWLSQKTGKKVTLPTEAQWEWASRAGTETPLWYGDLDTVFSEYANMADITVKLMAVRGVNPQPMKNPNRHYDFELKDPRSDDNSLFLSVAGSFEPNPWGLYDMHGNAAEWTRSDFKHYPYKADDGRNRGLAKSEKVIRGGSWHDRPFRCSSSYRLGFPPWQRVYHAGFRVIVED